MEKDLDSKPKKRPIDIEKILTEGTILPFYNEEKLFDFIYQEDKEHLLIKGYSDTKIKYFLLKKKIHAISFRSETTEMKKPVFAFDNISKTIAEFILFDLLSTSLIGSKDHQEKIEEVYTYLLPPKVAYIKGMLTDIPKAREYAKKRPGVFRYDGVPLDGEEEAPF